MTNASAMTLVLLVFLALFVGAVVVIFWGGGLFAHARSPQRRKREMERHQRAA